MKNVASAFGREDYIPVRLLEDGGERLAEPIFGKSNLISTVIRAGGLVTIPLDSGGLPAGQIVQVRRFS